MEKALSRAYFLTPLTQSSVLTPLPQSSLLFLSPQSSVLSPLPQSSVLLLSLLPFTPDRKSLRQVLEVDVAHCMVNISTNLGIFPEKPLQHIADFRPLVF